MHLQLGWRREGEGGKEGGRGREGGREREGGKEGRNNGQRKDERVQIE